MHSKGEKYKIFFNHGEELSKFLTKNKKYKLFSGHGEELHVESWKFLYSGAFLGQQNSNYF